MNLRILEMLSSKICHDLVSPVGAVQNGMELLEEMGADEDSLAMIGHSLQVASARLKLFRMMYGAGTHEIPIKPLEVKETFSAYFAIEGKYTLAFDPADCPDVIEPAFAKLLAASIYLAHETLPKGGTITVTPSGSDFTVTASGTTARPHDYVEETLSGAMPASEITPRLIHAAVVNIFCNEYGYQSGLTTAEDETQVEITIKKA